MLFCRDIDVPVSASLQILFFFLRVDPSSLHI